MVKLFANFDTKAPTKNYAEAVREFGFDKVVFLRRHVLYFILHTMIPAIASLAIIIALFASSYYLLDVSGPLGLLILRIIQIFGGLLALYLLYVAWMNYFNYTLDYTIITPSYISSYNQSGVFARQIKTIEPEKIKTITFSSTGLINSIFNFGEVNVLLEGEDLGKGEIRIDYIYKPERVKKEITRLTDKATDNEES